FNFNHPGWAEPGSNSAEPWHWEWLGDGGTMFGQLHTAVASRGDVARNADGRLAVFGVGPARSGQHLWQQAAASARWASMWGLGASVVAGSLQVVANADGRLELFAVDVDNRELHMFQVTPNGGWSDWFEVANRPGTPAAIGRNDDGRLELFSVD